MNGKRGRVGGSGRVWSGGICLLLLLLLLPCVARTAGAGWLYSVDVGTDELVQIDSQTGSVAVVGALGWDATDLDLVNVGSTLYALNSTFNGQTRLYVVNRTTGAGGGGVEVRRGGGTIALAEGLAQSAGQLLIAFRDTTYPDPTRSNVVGDLSATGEITNVRSSPASYITAGLDFDAFGVTREDGRLVGGDAVSVSGGFRSDLFRVDLSPLGTTGVGQVAPRANPVNDVVAFGGVLYGVSDTLFRLDLTAGSLTTVTLSRAGLYSGLAFAEAPPAVPEPSPWLLVLSGLSLWMVRGVRRVVSDRRVNSANESAD